MKPVSLLIVTAAGLLSVTVAAQGPPAAERPGRPTTESADERRGGSSIRTVTFCHEHEALKRRLVPQFLGPSLVGTYKTRNLSDEAVRALILKGVPKRMTAFQYTLTGREIDDLIAYLKIR